MMDISSGSCYSAFETNPATNPYQRLSESENVPFCRRFDHRSQTFHQDNSPQQGVNSLGNSQLFPPETHAVVNQTDSADPNKHGSGQASHNHVQADPMNPVIGNSFLADSIGHLQLENQNLTDSQVIPAHLFESWQRGRVEGNQSLLSYSTIKIKSCTEISAADSLLNYYCKNSHPEMEDFVCKGCQIRVCSRCLYSNHSQHVWAHVGQRIADLKTIVKDYEMYGELGEKFVKEVEDILNKEEQKEELENQETRKDTVKWYIDNFKNVFIRALEDENSLKMEIQTRILTLYESDMCQGFLNALFDKVAPSTLEKSSQILKHGSLVFKRIRSQDWRNDPNSFLFFTKGSRNELYISLFAQNKAAAIDNDELYRLEDVKDVTLNLVGLVQPKQDDIIYAITGLAISYILSSLTEMLYCRVEFDHCPESYEIILDMIKNCFMKKKEVQVDWVAKNPNKASLNSDTSVKRLEDKRKGRNKMQNETIMQVKIINKEINSYKLDFRFVTITDQSLAQILRIQVQNLQDLSINLSQAKINDKIIQELVKEILPSMKSLKSLELDFSFTELTDQSIADLLSMRLENFKHIQLVLEGVKIHDTSIESFANGMLSFAGSLEHLDLDLSATKVTDTSILSLLGIKTESLKHFGLNLSRTQITDNGIQEFVKRMLSSRKTLEFFQLDLSYTAITDLSLEQMPVIHLENLCEVRLRLSGTGITDKSIEVLRKKMLSSMKFLHSLELNLCNTAITDQSIAHLLALDLHALKYLSLNLAGSKISDKGLQSFAERMPPSMPSLEQLELDLAYTAIADESVINFLSIALSELRLFGLNISGTKVRELNIHAFLEETSSKNLSYLKPNPFKSVIQQRLDHLQPKELEKENADDKGLRGQEIPSKSLAYFELNPVKSLTQQNFNYLKLETLENKISGDKDMRKSISYKAPSLNNLEYFELLLSESRVGFVSIPYFATQMIHSANNLEHFEVNLANFIIPARILTLILSLPFKSVKYFKLDLSGIKLDDTCLRNFARGMLSSMKSSVKHFELNLTYASVTDDSIAQIVAVPLDKVEVFILNLFGTRTGDKSIQSFAEGMLPSMKDLKKFVLDLTGTTVTNVSVAYMLSIPLENLIDFKLNLGFTKISDTSVAQLVEIALPSMKKLEHFVLNLLKTLVTDQSADQLVAMPKESLKVLYVNLSRTGVSRSNLQTLAQYRSP